MKYTICYLYYDLLNLYGDSGNVKALKNHLENQGIKVDIKYISVNDKKDFSKYDLVYIGSGTKNNLKIALEDIMKYKEQINDQIKSNKNFFVTGNALELFGKYIIDKNNKISCLDIVDFYTEYGKRIVKDVKYDCEFTNNKIIGFENHRGKTITNKKHIFENEGIKYKNFIGTYIIGPILVRNPEFCKYYISKIIKDKFDKFNFKDDDYEYEENAYNINIESIN